MPLPKRIQARPRLYNTANNRKTNEPTLSSSSTTTKKRRSSRRYFYRCVGLSVISTTLVVVVSHALLVAHVLTSSSSSSSSGMNSVQQDVVDSTKKRMTTTTNAAHAAHAAHAADANHNNRPNSNPSHDIRGTTITVTPSLSSANNKINNTSIIRMEKKLLLYNQESDEEILQRLPGWIRDYVHWHSQMRRQFPGMELFTHPDAPPVLIRTCLGLCGGLHDRIGQLPWDLYLGHATQRVILVAWQRPRSLEEFLVPNHPQLLDWTVPPELHTGFDDMHRVRNFTGLFAGFPEDHPTDDFWKHDIDAVLQRATNGGELASHKILRHRLLGHLGEQALQERLDKEFGVTTTTTTRRKTEQVHASPHFGRIFWLFFRPSPPIEKWMLQIFQDLQLLQPPQVYSAVHCRVRHPKATSHGWNVVGKNPKYPADKTGLPWEGETRQFALDVATTALNCSRLISTTISTTEESAGSTPPPPPPIYFLSDSNDLVRHVAVELADDQFVQANRTELDQALYELVQGYGGRGGGGGADGRGEDAGGGSSSLAWIRARDVTEETAHLDRQKGRPASSYYSTFVDLMLVIHAHCVVYGIGYYAAFGAKISATTCQYIYQQEEWGQQAAKSAARICPNVLEEMEQHEQQQQQQQQ